MRVRPWFRMDKRKLKIHMLELRPVADSEEWVWMTVCGHVFGGRGWHGSTEEDHVTCLNCRWVVDSQMMAFFNMFKDSINWTRKDTHDLSEEDRDSASRSTA